MEKLQEIFSKNIIRLRKNKKLTQLELANELNYSDKNISKWENAQALPTTEVMVNISRFFDVSIDYLLSEHSEEEVIKDIKEKHSTKRDKLLILGLSLMCVQLLAVIFFVSFPSNFDLSWLAFIYSIPVMAIISIVYISLWFKQKPYLFIMISLLVWSFILCIYLSLFFYLDINVWYVFLVGIPPQVATFLWSGFTHYKKK